LSPRQLKLSVDDISRLSAVADEVID